MINVHGDSMGTAIVERLCRNQLKESENQFSRQGSMKNGQVNAAYSEQKL